MENAADFVTECGDLVISLCHAGHSVDETITRVRALYPHFSEEIMQYALDHSTLHFAEHRPTLFPPKVLQAGLYAVLAHKMSLKPDPVVAAKNLPLMMIEQLNDAVEASPETMAKILALVGSGYQHVKDHPDTVLGGSTYDGLRIDVGDRFDIGHAWPPTRQTVAHRFDSWNEAIAEAGFKNQAGRKKGQLHYSEKDYRKLMMDYLKHMDRHKQSPSFASFTTWSKETDASPSPAAVRNFYGSWSAALRAGRECGKVWTFM